MIVFEHEFVNRKETDKPAVNNIVRKFRRVLTSLRSSVSTFFNLDQQERRKSLALLFFYTHFSVV